MQFHKDCIDAWISRGNLLCPFDRSRISGRKDAIVRSKKSVEKMVSDSQQVVELSILGINSSNFPTKKQEQEVKPKRASQRCSTNSPDTSANGITVDVNELFIHGGVVRRRVQLPYIMILLAIIYSWKVQCCLERFIFEY